MFKYILVWQCYTLHKVNTENALGHMDQTIPGTIPGTIPRGLSNHLTPLSHTLVKHTLKKCI